MIYEKEGLDPAAARLRHAKALAAALQGASTRRDGKPWSALHFMDADPWNPTPVQPARRVNVVEQVRAINASRRKRNS